MAGTVEGEKIDVGFSGKRCIHSRNCVLGDPHVFVPNAKGQWIHPEAASVEKIVAIAESCPSGAITYVRKDGGPQEKPPVVNTVRIRENGPLAVHAEIMLGGETFIAPRSAAAALRRTSRSATAATPNQVLPPPASRR